MKKQISILLSLLVAFSSFFVSCDDGADDLEPNICKIIVSSDGNGSVSITNHIGTSVNVLLDSSVEIVATPNDGYKFLGWFVGNSETPVSTDEKFVFIASKNITLTAQFKKSSDVGDDTGSGIVNNHEFVDLGLPSRIKWATCNVGATNPWEYGGYYAWGEIEEKEDYSWETYKWCNGDCYSMTKYCTDSDYGTVVDEKKNVLDFEDDVAYVKWGGNWRMPTFEEQQELLDNCTWEWASLNGVNGYKVTGPNGNSIFIPAANCRYGTEVFAKSDYGHYWSSSLYKNYSNDAYYLLFYDGRYDWYFYNRYYGHSVRPVCGEAIVTVSVSSNDNGSVSIDGKTELSSAVFAGSLVTVVATADSGYKFVGWFVGNSEIAVSTEATYTFTVNENISLVAKFEEN